MLMSPSCPLVILASSRSNGHTKGALERIVGGQKVEIIDLAEQRISAYDYAHANDGDDYLPIARLMAEANTIIFCTPIYWYAMSGQLKIFFDRFSDLLAIHKDLHAKLSGHRVFLIATGSDEMLPEGFEVPFERTAAYLKMNYEGAIYFSAHQGRLVDPDANGRADDFSARIFEASSVSIPVSQAAQ
jgi:multimeric flavodoxin WrbA